jgi:hypothetical protein
VHRGGGGLLVSAIATGSLHDYALGIFYAALAVWAWLEMTSGVNWGKRLLGAAAILHVVVALGQAL